MNIFKKNVLGLLCICLFVSAGYAQEQPPAKVRVVKVTEKEMAENAEFMGLLYFDQISDISTEVEGMVRELLVNAGDRVKAGDVLLNISTDFLDKDTRYEQAKIGQLEARIKNTKKNLERFRKLLKNDAASETEYDNLFYTHQELLKERDSLKANLEKSLLKKEKCSLKAPFDGLIVEKSVGPGDWVTLGRTLFRLGSSKDLFVKVALTENLTRFVKKGDQLDVQLNAYGAKLSGTAEGILPVADEKTKNVFLKVRLGHLDEIPFEIAENMSASVFVPTSSPKKMKLIPRDALIKFQGKDFVYSVKDNKAAIVPVRIAAYLGENIATDLPHIKAGMLVVVDGNERLRPDQPVVLLNGEAAEKKEQKEEK